MSRFRAPLIWLTLVSAVAAQTPGGDPYFRAGDPRGTAGAADRGANPGSSVIQVNRRDFALPVQLHDRAALELRLFVSEDRGATWRLHSRSRPDVPAMSFSAPRDGEYWFYLHTMTPANGAQPTPDQFAPVLQLRVDTQRPVLDAEVFASEAGGIAVRWLVEDNNLDPEGISVEYRPKSLSGVEAAWSRFPTVALEPGGDPFRRTVQLWPETSQRILEVRVAAVDRAGNLSAVEREVRLPAADPVRNLVAGAGVPPARAVSDSATAPPTNLPWGSSTEAGAPVASSETPAAPASLPTGGSRTAQSPSLVPSGTATSSWGTSAPLRESRPSGGEEDARRLPVDLMNRPGEEAAAALSDAPTAEEPSAVSDDSDAASAPASVPTATTPVASQPISATPDESESVEELPVPEGETDLNSPSSPDFASPRYPEDLGPGGEVRDIVAAARLTKDRRFRLAYDLDSVGTAGIAKVQLWMTDDQGATWKPWNEDPDCESPISVELPGEGLYGFQLVVTARNGLAGQPPESGQPADMWVIVDQTEPTARIVEAPLGQGVDEGRLMIHWEADDAHLAKRPVTLHFGASADGPWNVLAAGLPNTGYYPWTIVPSLPRQVFLRLEVRDRAGNVAFHTLERPVDLTSLMPRGTLRGFLQGEIEAP